MTAVHRVPRALRIFAATVLAVVAIMLSTAAPASANNSDTPVSYGVCNAQESVDSSTLPVTRWAGGTDKFHSRLGTNAWNDVAEKLQRQGVITVMYAVGNTAWTTTTGLVETAINFCVLDKVGGAVDQAAHKIGKALMASGLVAAFVVASLILYIWRIGRGGGGGNNSSLIFQKALIVGLFGVMLAGSAASTGGGKNGDNSDYKPGVGSPGYFAVTIDNIVSASANSITSRLQDNEVLQGAETGWVSDAEAKKNPRVRNGNNRLGCAPYVKAMKDVYKDRYIKYAGGEEYYAASASVPLMLSAMWENTGLRMWIRAQFGEQNDYGKYMYCRLLEYNADAPRNPVESEEDGLDTGSAGEYDASIETLLQRAGVIKKGSKKDVDMGGRPFNIQVEPSNLAFRYSGSNKWRDRAWVGWAACSYPNTPGPGNDDGVFLIHKDQTGDHKRVTDRTLAEVCYQFFNNADWNGTDNVGEIESHGGDGDGLDWDDSDDDISQTDTTNKAKDFLHTLHGNKNGAGLITGFIYMISSIMIGVVFGMIALAVLIAKCAALLMMLMMFFTLLIALLPNMTASKIFDYAKQYTGLSLFAWGTQLILAVIAFITTILITVGGSVVPGGSGGTMGLMWTGFAPVIAVFCLHIMFKKMRIPSPMKVSAGMAWGKMAAAGAVGTGAVAGGTMLGNRLSNRVKGAAVNRGKAMSSGLGSKERRSTMTPGGKAAATATAAGTGTRSETGGASSGGETATRKDIKAAKSDRAFQEELKAVRSENSRGAVNHVKDRFAAAGEQFRNKPISTLAKGALIGGAAMTATALAPAALVTAGVAGGALVGRSGVAKAARTLNPQDRARSQADTVEAYRRVQANRRAAEAKNAENTQAYLKSAASANARVAGQQQAQRTSSRSQQQQAWGNSQEAWAALGQVEPQSNGVTVGAPKSKAPPVTSAQVNR